MSEPELPDGQTKHILTDEEIQRLTCFFGLLLKIALRTKHREITEEIQKHVRSKQEG